MTQLGEYFWRPGGCLSVKSFGFDKVPKVSTVACRTRVKKDERAVCRCKLQVRLNCLKRWQEILLEVWYRSWAISEF